MAVYFESRKNKRRVNQDHHLYMEYRMNHEAMIKVFLVADGMGGLACGELASSLAAEKWILKLQKLTMSKDFLGKSITDQLELLKMFSFHAIQEINEEVYHELNDQGIEGGTTLTVGILFFHNLILVNCGDSPAYYFNENDKCLMKLSKDQNVAEELVRQGKTTKNSSIYMQKKHMLTDYIGKYKEAMPHVCTLTFQPGDMVILGSDGAFGELKEEEIRKMILGKMEQPNQIIQEIMNTSERMGEEDNQTLILYVEENGMDKTKEKPKKKGFFFNRRAV